LDIIVAVDKQGWLARCVKPLTIDERMTAGVDQCGLAEADMLELLNRVLSSAQYVVSVLALGADTRDTQPGFEIV
jgi:hypothetical protein